MERERETGLHLVAVRGDDDRVVGAGALRLHDRPERYAEAGYWVAADARRDGVATRAVDLLTEHAFGVLSVAYVELAIAPENEASLALARRAGFSERLRELREFRGELLEFEIWHKFEAD